MPFALALGVLREAGFSSSQKWARSLDREVLEGQDEEVALGHANKERKTRHETGW